MIHILHSSFYRCRVKINHWISCWSCWCARAGHQMSLCWAHGLLFVVGAMCSPVYCLPLPSCYLIIVSVAPPVSPSLPSFVSLFSLLVSAVLFWSVVLRHVYVDCTAVPCPPAPMGWFLFTLFYFNIKNPHSPALESSPHLSHHAPWQFWPKWLERQHQNNDLSTRKYECPWRTWAQHISS